MNDYADSIKVGDTAEQRFKKCCLNRGKTVIDANRSQNILGHWDFMVDGEAVDVKARKKLHRHSHFYNDESVYIELRNVRGKRGWLYGNAHKFAFETPDGFIMILRDDLIAAVETLTQNIRCTTPTLYQLYNRGNRPDERVTMIKYDDLLVMDHYFIEDK